MIHPDWLVRSNFRLQVSDNLLTDSYNLVPKVSLLASEKKDPGNKFATLPLGEILQFASFLADKRIILFQVTISRLAGVSYFYSPAQRRGKHRTEHEVIQNSGKAKYIRPALNKSLAQRTQMKEKDLPPHSDVNSYCLVVFTALPLPMIKTVCPS